MTSIKLSICIPTFNRAHCLEINVINLIDQITSNKLENVVEIVIVNNASTDNTDEIAGKLEALYSFVRYIRNDSNIGIDGNIYKCSVVAKGDYVHLLSDDDIIINNGVTKILNLIYANPEINFFFLNLQSFTGDYSCLNLNKPIFNAANDIIYTDKNKFIEHIWIWATFVSSFVFKKEIWFKSNKHENYIGTDIYLSYALFDHLSHSKAMMLVAEPLLAVRAVYSGNYKIFYAFSYQWKRLLMEHAVHLNYDPVVMTRVFKKTILNNLLPRVINMRVNGNVIDKESWKYIYEPTKNYLVSWVLLYPGVFAPVCVLTSLKKLWKMFK